MKYTKEITVYIKLERAIHPTNKLVGILAEK